MLSEQQVLDIMTENLQEEIDEHPVWPDLRNRLGQIYAFQGRHDTAIECYETALKINPKYKKPYLNKAFCLLEKGDRDEAVRLISQAPSEFQYDFLWVGPSVMIYLKLRDFEEALKRLDFAIEHDKRNALWFHHRWLTNWYLERYEQARADLADAIRLCPTLTEYLQEHGLDATNPDKAGVNRYFGQLDLNRNMAAVCNEIGMVYFTNEQFDDARANFDRAVKIDLNLSAAYTNIGQMYSYQGDDEKARDYFKRAVELNPRNVRANMLLANEEVFARHFDRAIDIYEQLIENFPRFADVRYNYGLLCSDSGELEKAIQQFEIALEINPKYVAPRISLAFNLMRAGQLQKSLETYKDVIERGMESADIHLQMGIICQKLGDAPGALTEFDKAYKVDPEYPGTLYHWGNALQASGDEAGARQKWQQYLDEDPVTEYAEEAKKKLS